MYKRQDSRLLKCLVRLSWTENPSEFPYRSFLWRYKSWQDNSFANSCFHAVSYTHLDVYKRQIYYSVAQEYDSVDAIRANCIEAVTIDDRNGMRFSAECTSDMSDNIVYFYVIDFAGNIQTSSIKITSYMDTSAPSLIVDGIDENMWVNRDTLKNTWNIHTLSLIHIWQKAVT